MSEFKKGDVVERVAGYGSLKVGTICTVEYVDKYLDIKIKGYPSTYDRGNFRLIRHAYPNPPHKHAELIKAWADGAEVEIRCRYSGKWHDCPNPVWDERLVYRIKPSNPNADKIAELEKTIDQAKKQLQELKDGCN
ncbi:MAG: hypothetical protein AAFN81_10805 [Bacteroidota bacterium]